MPSVQCFSFYIMINSTHLLFFVINMQTAALKCYLCQTTHNLMEYDEEDGICQPCYQEQLTTMEGYKRARTNKFPEIDLIEEGIYLGNEDAATSLDILKERNITAICACGAHLDTPFLEDKDFSYKVFHIQDFPKQQILNYFPDHHAWMVQMRQQHKNILVHCAAGVSRSASFVIAYIMKEKQMPFHKAYELVKSKRKWVNPNSGFRQQLKQYNEKLGLPPVPELFMNGEEYY
jgi:hypothetical protein